MNTFQIFLLPTQLRKITTTYEFKPYWFCSPSLKVGILKVENKNSSLDLNF